MSFTNTSPQVIPTRAKEVGLLDQQGQLNHVMLIMFRKQLERILFPLEPQRQSKMIITCWTWQRQPLHMEK